MTEHKFTDEEIIKALECCSSAECEKCKYVPQGDCYQGSLACNDDLMRSALDLINRQKAEIDRLRKYYFTHAYDECHNEAINEFAERLKEKLIKGGIYPVFVKNSINDLVKELTEDKNENT